MILRFVVQEHATAEGVHWDLMLEQDGVLTTFRLEHEPAYCLTYEVRAEKIFDHPLRFLTYEGPVQKGAGRVRIADAGAYHWRKREAKLWVAEFDGTVLKGGFALILLEGAEWRFRAQRLGGADDN